MTAPSAARSRARAGSRATCASSAASALASPGANVCAYGATTAGTDGRRREDGRAGGGRLERGDAEAFGQRRLDVRERAAVAPRQRRGVDVAQELDRAVRAHVPGTDGGLVPSRQHEIERDVLGQRGPRGVQRAEVLVRRVVAGIERIRAAALPTAGAPRVRLVVAERHDANAVARHAQQRDAVVRRRADRSPAAARRRGRAGSRRAASRAPSRASTSAGTAGGAGRAPSRRTGAARAAPLRDTAGARAAARAVRSASGCSASGDSTGTSSTSGATRGRRSSSARVYARIPADARDGGPRGEHDADHARFPRAREQLAVHVRRRAHGALPGEVRGRRARALGGRGERRRLLHRAQQQRAQRDDVVRGVAVHVRRQHRGRRGVRRRSPGVPARSASSSGSPKPSRSAGCTYATRAAVKAPHVAGAAVAGEDQLAAARGRAARSAGSSAPVRIRSTASRSGSDAHAATSVARSLCGRWLPA